MSLGPERDLRRDRSLIPARSRTFSSEGHTSMWRRVHHQRSPGTSRAAAAALAPPSPAEGRSLPPLRPPAATHATVVSVLLRGGFRTGKILRRAYPERRAWTAREEGKRHGIERNAQASGGLRELTFNGCAPCSCFLSLMQSLSRGCEECPHNLDVLEGRVGPTGPDEIQGGPWRCPS